MILNLYMCWETVYNLHLSGPIKNWNNKFVEDECKKYTKNIQEIFYIQCKDEYTIHVNIKYGKDHIVNIAKFISNKYNVAIKIEVKETDNSKFIFYNDINGITIGGNYKNPKIGKPTNYKWVLVETYYKHGDYKLHIFNTDEELTLFIIQNLQEQEIYSDNFNLNDLIKKAIEIEENCIINQEGWGIREVRKLMLN